MGRYNTTDPPGRDQALVTAAEWFGGGQRIPYDPESARVLTEEEAVATPGALRVFERVAGAARAATPPTRAPPTGAGRLRRAGDHGRVHGERRPVRRRAHAPVAGHAAAAHPARRPGDAAGPALAARVRHGDDAGANVLP